MTEIFTKYIPSIGNHCVRICKEKNSEITGTIPKSNIYITLSNDNIFEIWTIQTNTSKLHSKMALPVIVFLTDENLDKANSKHSAPSGLDE